MTYSKQLLNEHKAQLEKLGYTVHVKDVYKAYVESTRMWESHSNCTYCAEFSTEAQAREWIEATEDRISDSDSDFVGDTGIEHSVALYVETDGTTDELAKLRHQLDNM